MVEMELSIMKIGLSRLGKMIEDLFTPKVDEKIVSLFEPGVTQFQKILSEGQTSMANEMKMAKGQGKMEVNENGVKRESNKGRGRFDLFPYEALEELAIWYELGAEKYGDRNWEKGISVKDCVNRMARHSAKACNGWMDEGPFAHLVAVMWNAAAAITGIKRNPYKNDFFRDEYLNALMLVKSPEEPITQETVTQKIAEAEHVLSDLGYENRQPLPYVYSVGSDLAKVDKIEIDPAGGIKFTLVFKDQKQKDRFQKEVAKYGVSFTGNVISVGENQTPEKS